MEKALLMWWGMHVDCSKPGMAQPSLQHNHEENALIQQTRDAMSTAGHHHASAGPNNELHLLLCSAMARHALLPSTATSRAHACPLDSQQMSSPVALAGSANSESHFAGEEASAVALLEASVKQYEESLGIRHRGIQTISQRAEQLFEVLSGDARLKVGTCCVSTLVVCR